MLRQVYLLSLLLCINISFCYDYLSKEELNYKPVNRKVRENSRYDRRRISRNQDYQNLFEQKPVAQIDVASFIKNPDESSINDFQSYGESHEKESKNQETYYDDASLNDANEEVIKDNSQDYQNLDSKNIPEVNILDAKNFIPQHNLNLNSLSIDKINSPNIETRKTDAMKINKDDIQFDGKIGHISRKEKKCALKNMKIPFFSHKKSESTTVSKNKKRKFKVRKFRKQTTGQSKVTEHNLSDNNVKSTDIPQILNKVNKRSYFERLCPACKQTFLIDSDPNTLDKSRKTLNNIIHNSRQYFQRKKCINSNRKEFDKPYNSDLKRNGLDHNIEYADFINERRWKRNDVTVEQKPKKVLEEVEKKVNSVKIHNNGN